MPHFYSKRFLPGACGRYLWLATLTVLFPLHSGNASIVLGGTRVVYQANDREVTLKVTNAGTTPALVQTWIDTGDINAAPDQANVPFTLTPPLFRLNQNMGQTLRIIYTQEPMPSDRESMFWLNVLEVPPAAPQSATPANSLQFAIRSRIKLIFRPSQLPGDSNKAAAAVRWEYVRESLGRGFSVRAVNPTPYYVTFSRVAAVIGGKTFQNTAGGMVNPRESFTCHISNLQPSVQALDEVDYTTINDYGAAVTGSTHPGSGR